MKKSSLRLITCFGFVLFLSNFALHAKANPLVAQASPSQQAPTTHKAQALAVVAQAIQLSNQIADEYTKIQVLRSVTQAYITAGQDDKILPLVNSIADKTNR